MAEFYTVPNIYSDISNQSQGYFAFRFHCQRCGTALESLPIRSTVATTQNIMDVGIGMLGGFWGRAAQEGEQMFGAKWHQEQAQALTKAWQQVQHEFHTCPKCHSTVCMRCWNTALNLCTGCAPDLKADGASFQHELNIDAQRQQIQQGYQAPQFNVSAVPSAVTPDMVVQPGQQRPSLPPAQQAYPVQSGQPAYPAQQPMPHTPQQQGAPVGNSPLAGSRFDTPGFPRQVMCTVCRKMGPPGKFCDNCGTKLPMPDLFCPNCSEPVQPTTRFCPECGTKLGQ
ncbi:MAG TPA: zinc ribbon domain-containing protein, partial [Ktedonobacteraceae bacterium]|nr:zinc ribbon domain-containing protein [Ktedonobacteraceae bacterium]